MCVVGWEHLSLQCAAKCIDYRSRRRFPVPILVDFLTDSIDDEAIEYPIREKNALIPRLLTRMLWIRGWRRGKLSGVLKI